MGTDHSNRPNILDNLMDRRTIVLADKITSKSIGEICNQILTLQTISNDEIFLIIQSGGGNTHSALTMCDMMTHLITAPITGIALGDCHSAATFIMLHCDTRIALPHAKFIIHSGTISGVSTRMDDAAEEEVKHLLQDIQRTSKEVVKVYMDRLGKSKAQVEAIIARGDQSFDNALSAEDAMKIGLVQKIQTGKLPIFGK
ncbi:MAG: ATP-dependent protease ClpP protease subunit [Acidimicrobiales bacterium]|jgi:ATP-dependent protease ClpP protease subunit